MKHLAIRMADAKSDLIETVNRIMRENDLPAFIMAGIITDIQGQVKDQEHMEVSNAFRDEITRISTPAEPVPEVGED